MKRLCRDFGDVEEAVDMWIVEGAVLGLERGELLECQDVGDWARNWGVVLAAELILVVVMAAAGWPDLVWV